MGLSISNTVNILSHLHEPEGVDLYEIIIARCSIGARESLALSELDSP